MMISDIGREQIDHEELINAECEYVSEPESQSTEEERLLIGTTECQLVGIRYYDGIAHPGEYVNLNREPTNPFDSNAIRIDNMHGEKVGHVRKEAAARVSRLLDNPNLNLIIEGTIPRAGNYYALPLQLNFYAVAPPSELKQASHLLITAMKKVLKNDHKFKFSPAFVQHNNGSKGGEWEAPIVQSKVLDWQAQAKELDEMFDKFSNDQVKNLPLIEIPSQLRNVSLMDHQIVGIRWLVHNENSLRKAPFYKEVIEKGRAVWLCEITQCSQQNPPSLVKGGILADEMGLGKTLQTIGLILASPPSGHYYRKEDDNSSNEAQIADDHGTLQNYTISLPTETEIRREKVPVLKGILKSAGLKQSGKKKDLAARIVEGIQQDKLKVGNFPSYMYIPEIPKCDKKHNGSFNICPRSDTAVAKKVCASAGICTLIVCPVSVMCNWKTQVQTYVKKNVLQVELFAGPKRKELLPALKAGSIDILLISYQTLCAELKGIDKIDQHDIPQVKKRRQENIFDMNFHRIVLDEAHTIRSTKTNFFKAVKQVKANFKLALTGTPFINKAEDIHSLISFLGFEPLSDANIFRRAISNPIKEGCDIGLCRLRATMSHIALRRSKALTKIKLVEKEVFLTSISFTNGAHKDIYDAFFGTFRLAFQAILQVGENEVMKNYTSIFERLLRMRQSCCSGNLVPANRRKIAVETWRKIKERSGEPKLSIKEGLALLECLKGTFSQGENELPECAICLMEMEENDCRILRTCAHVFCDLCITRVLQMPNSHCPLCRAPFEKMDMIEKRTAIKAVTEIDKEKSILSLDSCERSPKILALLEAIKNLQPDEKGVIFSQFTSFLDLIGQSLRDCRHTFVRIDGSMTAAKRIISINSFNSEENDSPRFILCSLHAAGTGINLTRGNFVFMMDCWWNEAIENQAMDRVHRIGQKRKVTVIRYVMKNTIEERMVDLQKEKSLQAKATMQKLKTEEKRNARISDLKALLLLEKE